MNSKGNRVVLLLVLGLAAFSSAVKELYNLRQLGLQVHEYVAQWSEKMTPAEIPPVPAVPTAPVVAKAGTCQAKHSDPSVEFSWLENVAQNEDEAAPVVKRTRRIQTATAKRERRSQVDPVQLEVRILNDRPAEQDIPASYEFPMPATSFKFKTRKPAAFRISPRDRELLKTLNRSLNLRIAS